MIQCINGEAIKEDRMTCAHATPDAQSWGMLCNCECVETLVKENYMLKNKLFIATENNKKLVKAFESFLPLCRDVVKASEEIERKAEGK